MLYEELLIPIFHEVILSVLNANPGMVRECISALKSVCSDPSAFTKKKIIDSVGLSQILCKHRNAVQIEQNLFKAEVAQAAAALFSK